ncbi:MAG: HAD family hydrolase [Planctomycetota bacterium]|jgi:HAD superfamily hydrolase (TIGR01549 family)
MCAIIFDFDGTLTRRYLDFDLMRAEMGVEGPILEALEVMDEQARKRAEAILLRYEHDAAENATLQEGAVEVVAEFRAKGHPVAILTRNARATLDVVLERYGIVVDAIRTRTDGAIKPSPEPVWSICKELGASPQRSWMVGDHLFDIITGEAAGTHTVLMIADEPVPDYAERADHVIRRLSELLPLVDAQGS